jgi:hypothetical protein
MKSAGWVRGPESDRYSGGDKEHPVTDWLRLHVFPNQVNSPDGGWRDFHESVFALTKSPSARKTNLEAERLIESPAAERIRGMDPSQDYWQRCAEALLKAAEIEKLMEERERIRKRLNEIDRLIGRFVRAHPKEPGVS